MCLERIPSSDGKMEDVKKHLGSVHLAKDNVSQLIELCKEVKEREKNEPRGHF